MPESPLVKHRLQQPPYYHHHLHNHLHNHLHLHRRRAGNQPIRIWAREPRFISRASRHPVVVYHVPRTRGPENGQRRFHLYRVVPDSPGNAAGADLLRVTEWHSVQSEGSSVCRPWWNFSVSWSARVCSAQVMCPLVCVCVWCQVCTCD